MNRIKSVYTENSVNWTRKYLGGYEEVWVSSQVNKKIHYIAGGDRLAAVYIINGAGTGEMYYVSTDYLGNILLLTRQNGTVAEEYSFDAWGRRRSPTNWNNYTVTAPAILYRGYTGHEHLDEFGLINMNGRCYDPILGRFLSPDNFVQMPDFTQNYNRYAYGLNNPLKYTDPSGNSLIATLIGLAVNYISQQLFSQPNTSNISDTQQNRSSMIGMGVSAIVNNINIIPGANGILKGIFAGGVMGGISGGLLAGIDASFSGGNFGDAFWAGFKSGAITGGAMGGVTGYFTAKAKNLNVWTGTPKRNDYLMLASYVQAGGDEKSISAESLGLGENPSAEQILDAMNFQMSVGDYITGDEIAKLNPQLSNAPLVVKSLSRTKGGYFLKLKALGRLGTLFPDAPKIKNNSLFTVNKVPWSGGNYNVYHISSSGNTIYWGDKLVPFNIYIHGSGFKLTNPSSIYMPIWKNGVW